MDFMFALFPIFFFFVFGLIAFTIISEIVRSAKKDRQNDNSPRLTVDAKLVAKRTATIYHGGTTSDIHHGRYGRSQYFATFEFESGDRLEFELEGREYGLLAEGDIGRLTFQGSRFLAFERK